MENKTWRLILDKKHDGYYNMTYDEHMFLAHRDNKAPTLRIYSWLKPFVTIGCNQRSEDVLIENNKIPFTRRITGGAAILHDNEITYSLVCSRHDLNLPTSVRESYKAINNFLILFYSKLNISVKYAADTYNQTPSLGCYGNYCFSSIEHYDLIAKLKKIGGNAQKLSRDTIFQHGSIPVSIDFDQVAKTLTNSKESQTKATSLKELTGKDYDYDYLAQLLADSFKQTFNVNLVGAGLAPCWAQASAR